MNKTDKKVEENVEALEQLSASSVESIVAKEQSIEDQEKALQEKLDALKAKKADVEKEKTEITTEMQKIPPFLAKQLLELQTLDDTIRNQQKSRFEMAKNLKGDLVKADLREDFVNKVLGLKGLAPKVATGGKKGDLEPHILELLDANPGGLKKADLAKMAEEKFGHNRGSVSRVLADESKYVAGGTMVERGIVKKEGDLLVKA